MASLDRELATYHQRLPSLLAQTGKFALVKDETLVGTFDTYSDALQGGYERFELEPFLVKKIETIERALQFTRHVGPVCR